MKRLTTINHITCLLFTAILSALLFSGCKKFLDINRQGGYTAEDYPYPGGSGPYDQFIFSAYNELRAFNLHSQSFITATSIRSDDADKGSTVSDGAPNATDMDNFPVSPSNGFCNTLWIGYYSLITKCNSTIKEIKTNANIVATDAVKLQTEGEARFLRAYGYFMLVRLFGRVPLIDSVFTNAAQQSNVPQSSAAQIYAFIESDLTFAAANLPLNWDAAKFAGRVTSGAANGLLAKVYLTQGKWGMAMTTAGLDINSGRYGLATPPTGMTSYDFLFREIGENCNESIFEVQATANTTNPTSLGVQYAQIMGIRGAGSWDLGWGWNTPSTYLEAAYEANDPRKNRTILYMSTPTITRQSIYGENLPVYSSPTGSPPNPMYNGKVYTNPSMRSSVGDRFGWWMNIRILRYADVLLMYAEAANETGNTSEALAKLEMVRARARMGAPGGTLPQVTTTDQATLRAAIRQERRIELAMEHDRFFDLVRWGIAQTALNAAGKPNFNNNRDVLLPIPQTQIDLSAGVLTQNPGY